MPDLKLILDFDGVICDAPEENALVAWLGVHPPSPRAAVSSYLKVMPRGFVDRFRGIRGYARVLEHFLVAHRPSAAGVSNRARFEVLYGCLPRAYVREFARNANAARGRCRTEEPDWWLDLHALYPGIADLLRANAGKVAVVTAKDEASVRAILARHGLGDTVRDVVGQSARKPEAVRALCGRHRAAPGSVTFVDDNLANVTTVAQTGVRAHWAMWGYHTPEDLVQAAQADVPRLRLAEVPALAA